MIQTSLITRAPGVALGVALFAFVPSASAAQTGWSATTQNLATGIVSGYETAFDPQNGKLYAADAQAISAQRQWKVTKGATPADPPVVSTTEYSDTIIQQATGKVVRFDAATLSLEKSWNHTGLLDNNGNPSTGIIRSGGANTPQIGWSFNFQATPNPYTGVATGNGTSVGQLPYGVAVDGALADPTIVTANTRTQSVTIYKASQATPTDADVIKFGSIGPGYSVQSRTPVVDSKRHKAYVAGFQGTTGVIFKINTETKVVEAVIPAPGVVGLALDQEGNRLFAGTYQAPVTPESPKGHFLRIIDLSKVTNSLVAADNTGAVVKNVPNVGEDTRPGYDAANNKVYLAASVAIPSVTEELPKVTVVDVNPASASYGTVTKTLSTPARPNAVTVDAERGLAYVPFLGTRILGVIDTKTDEMVLTVPLAGNGIDADVDPKTGNVFVSNRGTGPNGFGQVQVIKVNRPAELPKGDTGAAGAPGAPGAAGPAGAPGKDGLNSLALELSSLKLLGSKLTFNAPGAGVLNVSVKAGKRTIATGKRTATKAGKYSLTLTKTKYGKDQLKKKKTLKGTLTATFTPGVAPAKKSSATIQAKITR